jgi:hypothetical protein
MPGNRLLCDARHLVADQCLGDAERRPAVPDSGISDHLASRRCSPQERMIADQRPGLVQKRARGVRHQPNGGQRGGMGVLGFVEHGGPSILPLVEQIPFRTAGAKRAAGPWGRTGRSRPRKGGGSRASRRRRGTPPLDRSGVKSRKSRLIAARRAAEIVVGAGSR